VPVGAEADDRGVTASASGSERAALTEADSAM